MIRSENILKVIENFKKVLPLAVEEHHLSMYECNVNCKGHACGTTHCHGGWYAVAVLDLRITRNFVNGAAQMARDLGLRRILKLEDWAEKNCQIWGNTKGRYMFSSHDAFFHPVKRIYGAKNLQHIIDHWTEVYERVKTMELLSNPPVNDLINAAINKKVPELNQIDN